MLACPHGASNRRPRPSRRGADETGRRSEPQTPDTRQYDAASTGVGKTHLAVALGRAAILAGYAVLFIQATTLVAALARAHSEGRLEDKLTQLAKPRLLIVDELGYLPFEPDAAHLFFQLVSRRYERGSLLITSNRAIGEWGDGVRRPGGGDGDPRPTAAPQPRRHDPRRQLSAAREAPLGPAQAGGRAARAGADRMSLRLAQVGPQVPPAGLQRALEGARPAGPSRGLPGQACRDTDNPRGVSSSCRQGVTSRCRLTPMSARSRSPTRLSAGKLSNSARASSGERIGVRPRLTTWLGPRTTDAGLLRTTWPTTSQSNSMRTAARCCLTEGAAWVFPGARRRPRRARARGGRARAGRAPRTSGRRQKPPGRRLGGCCDCGCWR